MSLVPVGLPADLEQAVREAVSIFSATAVSVRREPRKATAASVPCLGCSRCGDSRDGALYLRTRPDRWLCAACAGAPSVAGPATGH